MPVSLTTKQRMRPAGLLRPCFDEVTLRGREFQRVGEQVGGDLAHPVRVAHDLRLGEAPAQGDAGAVGGVGQAVGCLLDDAGEVAWAEPELERGGFG